MDVVRRLVWKHERMAQNTKKKEEEAELPAEGDVAWCQALNYDLPAKVQHAYDFFSVAIDKRSV